MNYMAIPGIPNRPDRRRSKLHTRFVREIIIKTVCDHFDIPIEKLQAKGRPRKFAYPRQMIMYFLSEYTVETYLLIGLFFGGRDHTTAIHAKNLIIDLMKVDENVRGEVEVIKQKIIDNHI